MPRLQMNHDEKISEPTLGEIRDAKEIGWRRKYTGTKVIYCECPDCGKASWRQYNKTRNMPYNTRCRKCASHIKNGFREKSHRWKGGIRMTKSGYRWVALSPDDFFYSMTDCKGGMFEHRLVMAKHIKRCLLPWEVVHHRNGIKDDNRIENLELLPSHKQHIPSTKWQNELSRRDRRITNLEARVTQLEAENILLKAQLENNVKTYGA